MKPVPEKCYKCGDTDPEHWSWAKEKRCRFGGTWKPKCQMRKWARKYRENNKDKINKKRKENYHKYRPAIIKRVYGITEDEYNNKVLEQENKCLVCKKAVHRLYIDHCHSTGKVRGLLCNPCNLFVGAVEKDLDKTRAVLSYLEVIL